MKPAILLIFLAAALIIGIQKPEPKKQQPHTKQQVDSVRIVRVQIVGLKETDRKRVANILLNTPGILDIRFTGKDDSQIRFDLAKISLKQLGDAIQKAGYTPYFH